MLPRQFFVLQWQRPSWCLYKLSCCTYFQHEPSSWYTFTNPKDQFQVHILRSFWFTKLLVSEWFASFHNERHNESVLKHLARLLDLNVFVKVIITQRMLEWTSLWAVLKYRQRKCVKNCTIRTKLLNMASGMRLFWNFRNCFNPINFLFKLYIYIYMLCLYAHIIIH